MGITQLVQRIGADMGLPGLALDANDACALVFDDRFQIDMSYREQDQTLHLSSLIGVVQRSNKAELYRTMLAANATDADLGDAHFALEPVTETLVLCTMLEQEDQTLETTELSIGKLLKNCQDWRSRLGDAGLLAAMN